MNFIYAINIFKVLVDPVIITLTFTISAVLFIITYHSFKKERARLLLEAGIGQSRWVTVGGKECGFYYDIDRGCKLLDDMKEIANWYTNNIKELKQKVGIDSLAFIEREDGPVGAITKKDLLTYLTEVPSFIVRPKRRIIASTIKGIDSVDNQKVVIISDVSSTGASINKVVKILENRNAKVVGVVTLLNRGGNKTKELFQKQSIDFRFAAEPRDIGNLKVCN